MNIKDITGLRFGRLVVLGFSHTKKRSRGSRTYWLCKCDCGNETIVEKTLLGKTVSCGCQRKDNAKKMGENCNKNITGMRFGRLTAIEIDHKDGYHEFWKCHCDCGNDVIIKKWYLLKGGTNSCGCIRREKATTHGKSTTKLYGVWAGIKRRCYNKHQRSYKDYGGRGISLCADWFDFNNFYEWAIKNGYKEGLSIDRIDNDGNYKPENCRWVDDSIQANNTRIVKRISYNGETLTYMEWSRKLGAKKNIVWKRIVMQGWNEIEAITTPIMTHSEAAKFKKEI